MGTLLDKPETTKQTDDNKGNGIEYALCSMQGKLSIFEMCENLSSNLSYFLILNILLFK